MIHIKTCISCKQDKNLSMFYISKQTTDGYRGNCKKCLYLKNIARKESNPVKRSQQIKKSYQKKTKKLKFLRESYSQKELDILFKKPTVKICKSCNKKKSINEFNKDNRVINGYRNSCKECGKIKGKEYYKNNSEKEKKRKKEYEKNNKSIRNNRNKIKYKTNLKYMLIQKMRDLLRRCMKNKIDKTQSILGYTYEQLKQRIESQFKTGMNWENYGKWHIDHKKPVSLFKVGTNPRIINALCNLQPMWAIDNIKKSNKYIG